MNKRKLFFFLLLLIAAHTALCQVSRMPKIRIGIIAPFYADSVFNGANYRYSANNFPKFIVPGLDFIQGALIALDSLASLEIRSEVMVLDARSSKESVAEIIRKGKLDGLDMIIGSVKEPEFPALAAFAKKKKIPFISATYPNDAGVRDNPYTVILNPTLLAHCETLFAYLIQNHGMDKILLVRRNGSQEDKVESYFKEANSREGKPLLKWETVNIDSSFAILKSKLDSTRTNIIIGGSLDEEFAAGLTGFLAANMKKYPVKLIGMPNWDGFQVIKKGKYKDLPVYFTTGALNNRTDTLSRHLQQCYLNKFQGLPSDFAYKGFETTFYFGTLLSAHGKNMLPYINQPELPEMPEFRFRAVSRSEETTGPDYFENRHLYIMKSVNGSTQQAW